MGVRGVTMPRCYRPYYLSLSFGDLTQYLIPYMCQLVFANVSIQGWVIYLISIASLMVLAIFW